MSMIPNLDVILNLREQINERPDDYPLRLVYADALEETGLPNYVYEAECIRSRTWKRIKPNIIQRSWLGQDTQEAVDYPDHSFWMAGRCGMLDLNAKSGTGIHYKIFTLIDFVAMPMKFWLDNGPRRIRQLPIRRVRITDRNPVDDHVHLPRNPPWAVSEPDRDNITNIHNFEMVPMWIWYESQIPQEIFRVLLAQEQYFDHVWVDDLNQETRFDRQIRYFSSRNARLALSDACIAWAKSVNKSTVQITS